MYRRRQIDGGVSRVSPTDTLTHVQMASTEYTPHNFQMILDACNIEVVSVSECVESAPVCSKVLHRLLVHLCEVLVEFGSFDWPWAFRTD
jgi:hypothetical protein